MRISYSRIDTYQRCPHKYELAYVQKVPVPEPGIFALGSAVHDALKFMHAPGRLELPSLEAVIEEYCRSFEARARTVGEEEKGRLFESGAAMLTRHYGKAGSQPDEGRVVGNVELDFALPFGNGHSVCGRIDRIDVLPDGSLEVIDYKTGRRMPSQLDVDKDLQLAIYRLASETLLYPGREVTASLYYVNHGVKISADRSPEVLERAKAEIAEAVAGIEREEFAPKVGNHCDYCEYRRSCSVFRPVEAAEEERLSIEEMIRDYDRVDRELAELRAEEKESKARLGELEGAILEWFEAHDTGFYEVGGTSVIRDIRTRTSYAVEKVKEALEPLGLWEGVVKESVTKAAIEQLLKDENLSSETRTRLREAMETESRPVIKLTRATGDDEEDAELS